MAEHTERRNRPDFVRPELATIRDDLDLVHDLLAGTRVMHEKSGTYIRRWEAEKAAVYNVRRKAESVFDGVGRTLSAGVGMLFAKPPQVQWNGGEADVPGHWENIDGAGTKGAVFVKRFSDMAIRDGLAVILVDHPPPPADMVVTSENEGPLNLRPTWAAYGRRQVINWRTAKVDNETVPTLVVLHERTEVPDGAYGLKMVDRYRVLRLTSVQVSETETRTAAGFVLYEKRKGDDGEDVFVPLANGFFRNRAGDLATRLPIAVAYVGRTDAPFTADIPLLGVAWSNLRHWQISTNKAFYQDLCAFPQPKLVGDLHEEVTADGARMPGKLKIGPMTLVHLKLSSQTGAQPDFTWEELDGTSLDKLQTAADKKLEEMARQGLSFLVSETRAAETAEAKRLDATAENSTLATAAQGIEDAVNVALQHHAWYLGIEAEDAPVVQISRDFEATAMDPQTMTAYVRAVKEAGLPERLLLEAWQTGGRIPEDTDLDKLELEMMANAGAEAAAREAEAAAEAEELAA